HVTRAVHADRLRRFAELGIGLVVELYEWTEARRIAADDREHERKIVARGAHHRLRTGADADPCAQPAAVDRREHALVLERRTQAALPGHGVGTHERSEQVELVLEQHLVL